MPPVTHSISLWTGYHITLQFIYEGPPPANYLSHTESRFKILSAILVRKGRMQIKSDHDQAEACAGQWIICTGNRVSQLIEPGSVLLSLRLRVEWPMNPTLLRGNSLIVVNAEEHPELEKSALELHKVSVSSHPSKEFYYYARGGFTHRNYILFQEKLYAWYGVFLDTVANNGREFSETSTADERINKIANFLENYPLSSPLPKETIESISGIGIKRINKIYAEAYGETLHSFWDRKRFNYAQEALRYPYSTVKEVAYNLGFKRLQHFSSWFRSHSGVSPRSFRKEALDGAYLS